MKRQGIFKIPILQRWSFDGYNAQNKLPENKILGDRATPSIRDEGGARSLRQCDYA